MVCPCNVNAKMKTSLAWVIFVSLYFAATSLRCNKCHYDTFMNQTECRTTIQSCSAQEPFCTIYMEERQDGTETLTKGCSPWEVCKQNYCQHVIESVGRKSCKIECCQEDLCNRDGFQSNISPVIQIRGYFSWFWLITISCMSFSCAYL